MHRPAGPPLPLSFLYLPNTIFWPLCREAPSFLGAEQAAQVFSAEFIDKKRGVKYSIFFPFCVTAEIME